MTRVFQTRWFPAFFALGLAAACVSLPVRGRTQAAPPTTQMAANAPSGQPVNQGPVTTIRTFTNIVVLDVVVNDSQGNPVHGLKASDFSLFENNKPQTIRHFEEHSAAPISELKIEKPKPLPAGLFSNQPPAPVNGPVNVLLLDYLNTPLTSQPYARKQLLEYLDKAAPGTRIAIFALTTKLSMLQGFTSDMSVLKAVLTGPKGAPQASQLLTDPTNGGSMQDTTLSDALANDPTAVEGIVTQEVIDNINRFEAMQTSFEQDMRARYTLNGFDLLARYLVGIPGRKNVIWFSGSFPLDVEPNPNEEDPADSFVRNDDEVRKTDNLLTRAQVAVYPVDARGVMTDSSLNFATQTGVINENSGAAASNATTSWMNQTAQEHETMMAMAEDTGGTAYFNTNGLTQAVEKAVQNGSNYYTLTYSPTNTQWDERFRAIKVKVEQSGLKLTYRNGYFAVDPNDRNRLNASNAATSLVQPNTMATAMMHGGPDPSEILFKVRIRPASTPPEDAPLKSNQTNPDPKVKVQGPFREYGVDLVPDPHAVSCRAEASGNRHCAIEVWTFVYDRDGQKLITASNRLHTMLTPSDYAKLLSGGMAFHQQVSVPVKGHYYLRTAIHDMISDRVGAVEVPVEAVAKLEPLQTLPAVRAPTEETTLPPSAPEPAAKPGEAAPAAPMGANPPK